MVANGQPASYTLSQLLDGARATFVRGWLSEAVQVHRTVPSEAFELKTTFLDSFSGPAYYYARVRQYNDQWAWASPIRFRA